MRSAEFMMGVGENIPRHWSVRHLEGGATDLHESVHWKWLWAFPVGFMVLVAIMMFFGGFVDFKSRESELVLALATLGFIAVVVFWFYALFSLTAMRYRLSKDELSVVSLWLGFFPTRRRRFMRTSITQGEIDDLGKTFDIRWCNGYETKPVRTVRNRDVAKLFRLTLFSEVNSALEKEPLLCRKCGSEFLQGDLDSRTDQLECPRCGTKCSAEEAAKGRLLRFRMHYKPKEIVDVPGGFECHCRKWQTRFFVETFFHAKAAICFGLVCTTVLSFFGVAQMHADVVRTLLLCLIVCAIAYVAVRVILGQFVVYRLKASNGRLYYYQGIGNWGRTWELPLDTFGEFMILGKCLPAHHHSVVPDTVTINGLRMFRNCPPIVYHWIEGWIYERVSSLRTP